MSVDTYINERLEDHIGCIHDDMRAVAKRIALEEGSEADIDDALDHVWHFDPDGWLAGLDWEPELRRAMGVR